MSPIAPNQSGIALVAVLVFLLVIAAAVALRGGEEIADIKLAAADAEARRVDYVAQAGLQHALWTVKENACSGGVTIPATDLNGDNYSATISGGGSTTAYTLSADQDAWIRSDNPTNTGGGRQHVRSEGTNFERPLYRFDLSTLPAPAQINSAVAWFYLEPGKEHPEGPVTIHRLTADWTEGGATWDALGSEIEAAILAMIPAQPVGGVWVSVNLTGQVQAWINGQPNFGIALASEAEGIHAEYQSREDPSNPPRLEVVVGNGVPSPLNIQATGTLANGKALTLSRPVASAYQPPGIYTFQPDPAEGIDAYIWEANKSTNYGNDDEVWVSESTNSASRSLFRFNMGAIPAGSRIINATLSLQHESGNNPNVPVTAHRINQSWDEAAVTWNWADNSNNWDTQGGDFDATVFDTVPVGPASDRYEWDITALAQGWVDGAYPNYGVALATAQDGSIGERFFSSDETNADDRPSLTITYACECGSACMAPQGNGTILMAVVNPTTLVPADELKKALFESWGYTVNVISESANQSTYDTAMAAADAVFISETVNSGTLGTKLQNAPIGVVSQDGSYNDDLGFASGSAWQVDATIEIADTDHYITRPFAAGPLDIYAGGMELLTVSGSVAPDARLLGTTGGTGTLVTLDAGAMGSGGAPVPARRVMLPLGRDSNLRWDYLTSDGQLVVQRTIAWAMGADDTSIGSVLMVVTDPSALTAAATETKALIESWMYTVDLIDDDDTQANFDAAASLADVAFISNDTDDVALATKLTDATIGVVTEEQKMWGDLELCSDRAGLASTDIDITDNGHYITAPFPTGPLTILTTAADIMHCTATLAAGAVPLITGAGDSGLLTLDTGALGLDGQPSSGRRVTTPWGGNWDPSKLNSDGQTILRRSLEWGAVIGVAPPAAYDVLLVVANAASPSTRSAGRRDLIESWGHTVTLIDDGDSQANFNTAMAANDVVYVTDTVSGPTLLDKVTNTTTPVVNEKGSKLGNFGFSSSESGTVNAASFTSTNAAHYITEPYSGNPVTVFTSSMSMGVPSGTLAPDLQNVGEVSGTPALATLEDGATLWNGGSAPARRAHVPLGAAEVAEITDDGKTIIRRAIEWGAGAGAAPPPAQTVLLVSGNAASPPAKDAGMETLLTGWGFTVDWIDDGDSQANFDTKMAAADVVYVSGTVSGPTLLDKVTGVDKGVVNEINGKLDNFGFSSSTSLAALSDRFSKTDPAHYITESFGGEWATVFTSGLAMPIPSGTLAPDLQTAGQVSGLPGMVTLAAGGTRWDGNPAPARRVHLPFTNADSTQLTADGETIMERAIRWAAGEGGDTGSGGGGGPTGVTFEAFTEASNGNTTSLDIAKPGGTGTGDLLIATLATDGSTAGSIAPPAGWAVVDLTVQSGAVTYGVWWKLAGAGEPANYTFSWSGGEAAYGTVMRFTGHDPADPIDVFANAGGSSSAPASPAVTTTVADAMILRLGGFDDDDIDQDVTGLTDHTTITMDDTGNGPNTTSSGAGYVLQPAAGSSGTANFALTGSEQYRAVTLAIAPAP